MKLSYKFFDAETGVVLTKAESTQMAVDMNTKESLWACPPCFVDKVKDLLSKEKGNSK
jgi:acyl-CoA thioester hydrolase